MLCKVKHSLKRNSSKPFVTDCTHIKSEVKTEEEELRAKTGGYICPECSEHFFYEEYFVEHIREHHCDTVIVEQGAKDEGSSVQHAKSLQVNTTLAKSLEPVQESLPSSIVSSEIDLQTHSPTPDKTEMGDLIEYSEKAMDVNQFKCSDCSYTTDNRPDFNRHRQTHSGKILYFKCSDCSYATAYQSHLKKHQRVHTGEKPFKCADCSFATAYKSSLNVHKRIHSGEKPYSCLHCSYAATCKATVIKHERIHTLEKRYQCSHCSYAATRKSHLKMHYRQHKNENQLKVHDCSHNESGKSILKSHLRTCTSVTKHLHHKCYKCSFLPPTKSDLILSSLNAACSKVL